MPLRLASESLSGCTGCEISLLNTGEGFLSLLRELEIVHMPLLMDRKYFGETGDGLEIDIPEADIGLISGAIRNEEQLRIARKMRERCRVLVAFGTCATHGGVPALTNLFADEDILRRCYRTAEATDASDPPVEVVPPFLDRAYALDEKIAVDAILPGCPPHPDNIAAALQSLLKGELPSLPSQSVCECCPVKREGKGSIQKIRRFVRSPRFQHEKPISEMKCLLEQGFLCMGPVTLAGCSGNGGEAPLCIQARVPCRGCYGPVKRTGNPLLDMMNALASNGVDIKSIPDRQSILRFCGAHGMLRRHGRPPV